MVTYISLRYTVMDMCFDEFSKPARAQLKESLETFLDSTVSRGRQSFMKRRQRDRILFTHAVQVFRSGPTVYCLRSIVSLVILLTHRGCGERVDNRRICAFWLKECSRTMYTSLAEGIHPFYFP